MRRYGGFLLLAAALALSTLLQSEAWNEWGLGILDAFRVGSVLGVTYVAVVGLRVMYLEARSLSELLEGLRGRLWNRGTLERVAGAPVLLAGLVVMLSGYSTWKPHIVRPGEATYDVLFAAIDRSLHFGAPWRWTHALFNGWTPFLDGLYATWYQVLLCTVLFVAIARPLAERARFFWSLGLLYVLVGTLLARLMASGGPVFYADITGGADFLELVRSLDGTIARELQRALWEGHVTRQHSVPFPGVSAMPSLHVGVAALLAFWAWRVHRWIGLLFGLYATLIAIGSVHLGWHYAIDGYLSAAVAGGCWLTAGWIVGSKSDGPVAEPVDAP